MVYIIIFNQNFFKKLKTPYGKECKVNILLIIIMIRFAKDLLQNFVGKQELKEDIKKQLYVKHVQKLKMYARLVYLIWIMDFLLKLEINF